MVNLNLQTNNWYQIQVKSYSTDQSVDGTVLYNHGLGAVFMQETNTSHIEQRWQFYPINDSYVLRTQGAGPIGYLIVAVGNTTTPGNTVPEMANDTIAVAAGDDSMYWKIGSWNDGTFFLTNNANGSDWHLSVMGNSLLAMSSNITAPQDGQSFSFKAIGTIDDVRFSSVIIPTATATSTTAQSSSTSISSTTTSSTTTSSTASSKGLSTGASAGIGVGVAAIAIIALLILGFWLMRRRKRRTKTQTELPAYPINAPEETKHQPQAHQEAPYYSELSAHHEVSVEMPAYTRPSELEGNMGKKVGGER